MDNSKGQTIFLSVIGIATLLVAIIGATFAWFSVNVQGNLSASSIIVTTAVLGSITFTDGSVIDMSNIRPEGNPQEVKQFTVSNATANLTRPIQYYVAMDVVANTLSDKVNQSEGALDPEGVAVVGDHFVHSIEPNAETTTLAASDVQITTGFVAVPSDTGETRISGGTEDGKVEIGVINGVATHGYTYTIKFTDSHANQNNAQGTQFNGRLQVHTIDTQVSSSAS